MPHDARPPLIAHHDADSRSPFVRPADIHDVPGLLALEVSFPGDRISRRSFLRLMTSRRAAIWVATDGEVPTNLIGNAVVSYPPGQTTAHLLSLVVDPAARGRGVGLSLLQVSEQAARDRGYRVMRLDVRVDNGAAIQLYQKAGYASVGIVPGYYEDGCDAIRMRKNLLTTA